MKTARRKGWGEACGHSTFCVRKEAKGKNKRGRGGGRGRVKVGGWGETKRVPSLKTVATEVLHIPERHRVQIQSYGIGPAASVIDSLRHLSARCCRRDFPIHSTYFRSLLPANCLPRSDEKRTPTQPSQQQHKLPVYKYFPPK